MRISDWRSDVCASDLDALRLLGFPEGQQDALEADIRAAFAPGHPVDVVDRHLLAQATVVTAQQVVPVLEGDQLADPQPGHLEAVELAIDGAGQAHPQVVDGVPFEDEDAGKLRKTKKRSTTF